jgi:peptidoglycan/LPS O-acetylase OafA/YrhL
VRPPRFPAFNGLRALAAVLVIGVHTSFDSGVTTRQHWGIYTSRLEIGVSVFFLISGFLLYRPFVAAHLLGVDRPRTGAFWLRRLLRIIPAYWVALFLITTVFKLAPIGPNGWQAYATHYLFLQIYFPSQRIFGITQAWSLCVEMTFYLFIPLYAMAIGWRRSRRSAQGRLVAELIGLVVMCVVSFLWRSYFITHVTGTYSFSSGALTWLPSYLDVFAFGMFLAVLSAWTHQHDAEPGWLKARAMPWISWLLAIVCFYAVSHLGISILPLYASTLHDIVRQELYALFALFVLIPAVFGPQDESLVRKLLRCWPVASLGAVSYGVYLWHQSVIAQSTKSFNLHLFDIPFWPFFFAVVAISTAIATISYFTIERPALKLKNTLTWFRGRTNVLVNEVADPNDPSA